MKAPVWTRSKATRLASDLIGEIKLLEEEKADLLAMLDTVEEFLDERADAEYHTDRASPVPNPEMALLMDVRAAIKQARGE